MRMATEQKARIAYDDIGSGDPVIVLVHGLFANRTYYAAQASHLAAGHRVLNLDLRGHGDSDVPEQGYSLAILAGDVIRVCDDARVSRAVFCGHSIPVALKVAVLRPDLAAGLVLLDGGVLLPPEARQGQAHLAQVFQTDGWRDALLKFLPSAAGSASDRVREDLSVVPRCYGAPLLADIASSDSAEELAALGCPLMYVHSEIPTDLGRLRTLKPEAIVEEIPGVGHYPMLTAPEEVNVLLDRFLEMIG
jgi:pimeloyl-ACP methyl ester carboxylesterase